MQLNDDDEDKLTELALLIMTLHLPVEIDSRTMGHEILNLLDQCGGDFDVAIELVKKQLGRN